MPLHILAPRAVACDNLHLRASAHFWHVSAFLCNREFLGISCYIKKVPDIVFTMPGRNCSWCHPISQIGISATNLSHFRVRKSLSILLSFNAGITAAATRISFTWRLTNPFHREFHTVFHHRQLSVISFRMYSLCSSTFCF